MGDALFKIGSCKSKADAAALESLIALAAAHGVADAREGALSSASAHGKDAQRIRALISVACDLISHGWRIEVIGTELFATIAAGQSGRDYVKRIQLGQREHQLNKQSVRDFIKAMEMKRLGPNGWVSIYSLIRDGKELAASLRNSEQKSKLVPEVINPYIQIIDSPEQECAITGLRLMDVWRYFRHTWAMPYNSIPGRSMLLLIRDAAAKNHPVIGIAALGSAIAQLSCRDRWIGWTPEEFVDRIQKEPSVAVARWVAKQLQKSVAEVYKADILKQRIISRSELARPSNDTISKLRSASKSAREKHREFPDRKGHKARIYNGNHWSHQVGLQLFKAKRCEMLARLLQVKNALNDCEFTPTTAGLRRLVAATAGSRAIEILLRTAKAQHHGIDMLDIIICGAIPPYNPILGGKLVALLLCSPEISRGYDRRYKDAPSVIASSIAGRSIFRRPRLVLLGTTSLYGERLNQYHRVQIPEGVAGCKYSIRYTYLGESSGFGSSHLRRETVEEIELLLAQLKKSRVNSIFGEGVSPRLRKIRDGLDLLGFHSDVVLKHGNSRLVYGIPLAANFRDVLLGLSKTPRYALPQTSRRDVTAMIAQYWGERWLLPRLVHHPEVIAAIADNDLRLPDRHAARVKLPALSWDTLPLFA